MRNIRRYTHDKIRSSSSNFSDIYKNFRCSFVLFKLFIGTCTTGMFFFLARYFYWYKKYLQFERICFWSSSIHDLINKYVKKRGFKKKNPRPLDFIFSCPYCVTTKAMIHTHTLYIIYIYMINLKWYIIPQDITYNYRNPHPLT